MSFYLSFCIAVPPSNEKMLCNANSDEFPPDDFMEDDLIETQRPERGIMSLKEVKKDF